MKSASEIKTIDELIEHLNNPKSRFLLYLLAQQAIQENILSIAAGIRRRVMVTMQDLLMSYISSTYFNSRIDIHSEKTCKRILDVFIEMEIQRPLSNRFAGIFGKHYSDSWWSFNMSGHLKRLQCINTCIFECLEMIALNSYGRYG